MMEKDAEQFLNDYAGAWRAGTVEDLIAYWDEENFLFYKAEEIGNVYNAWNNVVEYWRMNEEVNETTVLAFSRIKAKTLPCGWTICAARMRWDIRFKATAPGLLAGKAMGGENHVFAHFYKGRLAGWTEAPDAPALYVWGLYEREARGV